MMYKRVSFILDHPANLSVEFNEVRFHNLHLFAGKIEEKPDKHENNVLVIKGSSNRGKRSAIRSEMRWWMTMLPKN